MVWGWEGGGTVVVANSPPSPAASFSSFWTTPVSPTKPRDANMAPILSIGKNNNNHFL